MPRKKDQKIADQDDAGQLTPTHGGKSENDNNVRIARAKRHSERFEERRGKIRAFANEQKPGCVEEIEAVYDRNPQLVDVMDRDEFVDLALASGPVKGLSARDISGKVMREARKMGIDTTELRSVR